MSQNLLSQQSLEAPSRYTLFERDVFGCSSPQSQKRPKLCLKNQYKVQKIKRFSKVALAGESPNLQDVSSGLSKSKKSAVVFPADSRSVQIVEPSTSRPNNRTSSPLLFDSRSGSSTPSLRSRNASNFRSPPKVASVRRISAPQATQDPTSDLLLTESLIESSAVINGQPNVLRIDSSPDAALPYAPRLSRDQQVELSVRRAKEWLESLPENSDPVPYVAQHDDSVLSSASKRSDAAANCTGSSVLVVAPDPTVREVRILLQRLDPQVLLRVPIRDIENLLDTPSNLSLRNVQKTMNNLLSSNKIGVTAVEKKVMKSIQSSSVTNKGEVVNNRESSVSSSDCNKAGDVNNRESRVSSSDANEAGAMNNRESRVLSCDANKAGAMNNRESRVSSSVAKKAGAMNNRESRVSSSVAKKAGAMNNRRSRGSMEKKNKRKRKLFTVERQSSNFSELNVSTENMNVQCPYSPPTRKRVRPPKKTRKKYQKKLLPESGLPNTRGKRKSPCRQNKPSREKSPAPTEPAVITRTRSSDILKARTTPEPVRLKANTEQNPSCSNVPRKSHEMTLRKKSNSRRTSLFFQPKSQVSNPKKPVKNCSSTKQGPRVVCTFLHREEVDRVAVAMKKLGGIMDNKVSALTTHVVCGGPKRTINLLRGIARGCWLVTYEWVLQSVGKRKWIEEEPFELKNFSPAVQKCRIARETLGLFPTIFEKVGTIYVAPQTAPPKTELNELLKLCGAKVVTTTRRATIVVGAKIPGIQCVKEVWVLDSIQENVLLPVQRYILD